MLEQARGRQAHDEVLYIPLRGYSQNSAPHVLRRHRHSQDGGWEGAQDGPHGLRYHLGMENMKLLPPRWRTLLPEKKNMIKFAPSCEN